MTAGDSVSDSGIAEAFREKDFTEMYKTGLFKITGSEGVTAAYNKAANGLLVSGKKEDLTEAELLRRVNSIEQYVLYKNAKKDYNNF